MMTITIYHVYSDNLADKITYEIDLTGIIYNGELKKHENCRKKAFNGNIAELS